MERITEKTDNGYAVGAEKIILGADGYTGLPIEKLAALENLYEDLSAAQKQISKELEQLRQSGKTNSCKFRELMGKKLMNSHVLSVYEFYWDRT